MSATGGDAAVVVQFNDAINARDVARLGELMTDDHRFVDSAGVAFAGRDTCLREWRAFLDTYPDYRNVFDRLTADGPGVVDVVGHSECSYPDLAGPARWRVIVDGARIVEWRVFDLDVSDIP